MFRSTRFAIRYRAPPGSATIGGMGHTPAEMLVGFTLAGEVRHRGLNLSPADPPLGRTRHSFGEGPFARLMPKLPILSGLYAWQLDADRVVYLGQSRSPLAKRLCSNGYATISTYNTLARQPGRTNGGQQTYCRVNGLANLALTAGSLLTIWYRVTTVELALTEEARWMTIFGKPDWNRRLERHG